MTSSLTVPFLLPQDLLVIPVADLASASREALGAGDDDFAITRPRSRKASSVIDRDSAELLERFREARTIAQAVADFSRERDVDPHTVLTGALPVLRRLIAAHLLVPAADADSLAKPVVASFERGDRVGRFEVVRRLSVLFDVELYQARASDGTLCLLKIARAGGGHRILHSLRVEATVLERLRALTVPRLLEMGEHDDLPFLAIEWRAGVPPTRAAEELRGDIRSRRHLLGLCIEIAEAYAHLHGHNVTHGDVHDLNVLIDRDGRATIVDFGQANILDDPDFTPLARGGVLANYDPELAAAMIDDRHAPLATFASEQFAVGTLLYEVVTGHPHLELSVRRETALAQVVADPPRSFVSRGVPAWMDLERVVQRMLDKDPGRRFLSMHEVVAALRTIDPSAEQSPDVSGETHQDTASTTAPARVARYVLDRLTMSGELFSSRFPEGPHCSVNNGAAGIALAWYRLALFREDAETLSIAAAWSRRAQDWMGTDEDFFLEDESISAKNVGRAGLFHSSAGVHCVRSLIAHAEGDDGEAKRAATDYVEAARVRCTKWDLTLGRAGALLGCVLQYEAEPNPEPRVAPLGRRLAAALERRLTNAGTIRSSTTIDTIGIAHGWAGGLYALLRWSQATGQPISTLVVDRLDELASFAQHSGRGISWPRFRDYRDASLQSTWCNGDAGLVFLWLLASELLDDRRYLPLAEGAAWNVADRGPERTIDLCCGSAGRAYAFLALFRKTGDEIWVRRAKRFAEHAARELDPDATDAHRLYKGALGVALLVNELEDPRRARMPLFESEGWQWRHTLIPS
jgi:serine/threonine protein kinase